MEKLLFLALGAGVMYLAYPKLYPAPALPANNGLGTGPWIESTDANGNIVITDTVTGQVTTLTAYVATPGGGGGSPLPVVQNPNPNPSAPPVNGPTAVAPGGVISTALPSKGFAGLGRKKYMMSDGMVGAFKQICDCANGKSCVTYNGTCDCCGGSVVNHNTLTRTLSITRSPML